MFGRRCFCATLRLHSSAVFRYVLSHLGIWFHLLPCRGGFFFPLSLSLSLRPSYLFVSCLCVSHSLTNPLLFTWHPSLLPLLLSCTHSHLTYNCVCARARVCTQQILSYFSPLYFIPPSIYISSLGLLNFLYGFSALCLEYFVQGLTAVTLRFSVLFPRERRLLFICLY